MKQLNLKPLVASVMIAGSTMGLSIPGLSIPGISVTGISAAQADNNAVNSQSMQRHTTESRSVNNNPPDRNITNPNIGPHSGPVPDSGATVSSADIDHHGIVNFEPNSVTLNRQAERQLQQLVAQLDKTKPVSLTVAMSDGTLPVQQSDNSSSSRAESVRGNQDSSAGYPAGAPNTTSSRINPADGTINPGDGTTEPGIATIQRGDAIDSRQRNAATGSRAGAVNPEPGVADTGQNTGGSAREIEEANRVELISRYRMENIRRFMEESGVEVVESNMESATAGSGDTQSMEAPATDDLSGIRGSQAGQPQEEVQLVRILVIGEIQPEGLSSR